ncbi:MAG: MaoC family dehydratase N-terminal domain-containing protein, partial [Streptosporangiales bacterium]|nr:MaoC family dehydratase N-terminal domain-containing protein [Streptosporangiales bacterium]
MTMHIADLSGADLGTRVHRYDERDVLLYAIAVGASADQLDLVYERNLRVLPTFVLTLGLWAVEAAGALGVYDPAVTLHAAQELVAHRPLPASGAVETAARI